MNIELVKKLRIKTKAKIRDCVTALENVNWDYEIALKNVFSLVPQYKETTYEPINKSPVVVYEEYYTEMAM